MGTSLDSVGHSGSASLERSGMAETSTLMRLPREMIIRILEYLPQQHLLQLMFTCTRLACHARPVLYRHLDLFIPNGIDIIPHFYRLLSYDRTSFRETRTLTIRNTSSMRAEDISSREYYTAKTALGTDDYGLSFDVLTNPSITRYVSSDILHGVTVLNLMVYHIIKHLTPDRLESFSFEHTLPLGYRVLAHLATHQTQIKKLHIADITLSKRLEPCFRRLALLSQLNFWWNRNSDTPLSCHNLGFTIRLYKEWIESDEYKPRHLLV